MPTSTKIIAGLTVALLLSGCASGTQVNEEVQQDNTIQNNNVIINNNVVKPEYAKSSSPSATVVEDAATAVEDSDIFVEVKNSDAIISNSQEANDHYVAIQQSLSYYDIDNGYSDVSPCKLKDYETERPHMAIGFPIPVNRPSIFEKIVVQVVATDFADFRTSTRPEDDLRDRTSATEKFWESVTYGIADIEFRFLDHYIEMPEDIGYYNIQAPGTRVFESPWYRESVRLADPLIDFSDVDIILISGPPQKEADVWRYTAEAAKPTDTYSIQYTDEKPIYNILVRGEDNRGDRIQNWIHEFGHMLGLTDFGHEDFDYGVAYYDIMTAYVDMELYAWNRFLLGSINSNHIECKTDKLATEHMLSPIESPSSQNKSVMIPLSQNKILIVESRRPIGYDKNIGESGSGVVVYVVDTTMTSKEHSLQVQPAANRSSTRRSMALKPGDYVTYSGYTITVKESGELADLISIVYN